MKMMTRRMPFFVLPVVMFALLCMTAAPAKAVELFDSKLQIHGFGHQGYLLTNKNKWLDADNKGSFNFNNFGLLFTVQPQDDLTIWAQLFADDTSSIRLDWAFVDYKFSDQLRVRGGQVRNPIGLLSETRDIKYLQLSTIKPYIYQDESALIAEAFRGASLIYTPAALNGDLTIDLIGGQPVDFEGEGEEKVRNLVGTRITYNTPLEGLSLVGSAATSQKEEIDEDESGRQNLYVASVAYSNYNIDFKTEYAFVKDIDSHRFGYYTQAGYTFFDKLTPFVRYDYLTMDKSERSDPAAYQKGLVVGIGYKFNSNVSFKIEDHFIKGYTLPAHREIEEGEPETEDGRKNWNLFAASLNFIF